MQLAQQRQEFVLNKPLSKVMWTLSLPAIAAMVLFGLNAFMDTVYIGQLLNEQALAGVAIVYPLTAIMMGLGSWAGTGAANRLSIAIGAQNVHVQERILSNTTLMSLLASLIFTVPAYLAAEPLIRMLGGTGAILDYGVSYFQTSLYSTPFWIFGLSFNMIVRGEGKMKTAATMMTFGLLANLVLTPVFILVFDMGVTGAAWATNIGMLIYTITGYLYFKTGRASFPAHIDSLKFDPEIFGAIVKLGLPGFIITIMSLVQAIAVFNAIVNNGTESDLAFFAAANRIQLFFMTPLFGLMRAMQPVVGINFGARNFQRVKSSFILFSRTGFYIMAPFWLALNIFPETCMHLVLPGRDFTAQELFNLRIYMGMLPLLPLVFMGLTFFPAIDQPKYGSIIGTARQLIFYVPVMLILPRFFGLNWVYWGSTIIDVTVTGWIVITVWKLFKRLSRMELAEGSS